MTRARKDNGQEHRRLPAKTDGNKRDSEQKISNRIKDEVLLFTIIAVCILLFISNFGVGGVIGSVVSGFMFGVMGIMAYVFPIVLLVVSYMMITFKYDDKKGGFPLYKVICLAVLAMLFSMFFELLTGRDSYNAAESYLIGYTGKTGGGFLGGLLCQICVGAFGRVGSFVIDIIAMMICVVIYTGRSLMNVFRRFGQNVRDVSVEKGSEFVESAKERIEERMEERRVLRMEKKAAAGVSFDDLNEDRGNEPMDIPSEDMREIREDDYVRTPMKDVHELLFEEISEEKSDFRDDSGDFREVELSASDISASDLHQYMELEPETGGKRVVNVAHLKFDEENIPAVELEPTPEPEIFSKPEHEIYSESEPEIFSKPEPGISAEHETEISEEPELERRVKSVREFEPEPAAGAPELQETKSLSEPQAEAQDMGKYVFPPVDLLNPLKNSKTKDSEAYLNETAMKLRQTLKNFGVNVTVTEVTCGPTVTRYEIQPEPGIKVSKIINLTDDIKLNLAAADIRMEAPIPGKAAIGIEVPNKEAVPVMFRELVESDEFKKHDSKISFAAGKDIAGKVIMGDIAKMPHMLIAGSTGSGKSVCINTIIMSILYHARPDEVKLIMIDPKVVELSVYNGIPHLLIPVVTDPKKAAGALNWAVSEMMDRYDKFAANNVRDMKGYNALAGTDDTKTKLPQIVVIVDELADLMMVASNDVEDAICRLAQLARAAGIHLIIATQRPSVNVITGLIKANMPSRIAFAVTSGVDSRTILDMVGAEKLLGKGDMLYYPQGLPKPVRLQGAFVSDSEVGKVVDFIKEQCGETVYSSEIEQKVESLGNASGGKPGTNPTVSMADVADDNGNDELFQEADQMELIDGKKISSNIKDELKERVAAIKAEGKGGSLAVVLVGEDPASQVYVRNKENACEYIGIGSVSHRLTAATGEEELLALIDSLNKDPEVIGILVQLPLPKHIDEEKILLAIDPSKDVDCFHPCNVGNLSIGKDGFLPCTPHGVIELLKRSNVEIEGKNACIIGRSNIVGKPMSMLMLRENATVTIAHSRTADLKKVASNADILIVAMGKPKFIGAEYVKEGAVVIDVGIHRMENGKLCGDVDFDAVSEKCSLITPVPGGVGPMTIAMLMANCVKALENR